MLHEGAAKVLQMAADGRQCFSMTWGSGWRVSGLCDAIEEEQQAVGDVDAADAGVEVEAEVV